MKASISATEGTTGLITYMRTDSPRVAPEAVTGAREWIGKELGKKYLPETPNAYKGKKDAQDAHEAIRPTDASRTPESIARYLSDEQFKLYTLIWRRFVASQMVPAVYDVTTANIAAISAKTGKTYDFRVSGSVMRFDGFLKVYEVSEDKKDEDDESANRLPNLDGVKTLERDELLPEDHFTQPPPRYNEVLAGEGAGRARHRPAVNLRIDHQYHSGPRIRGKARRFARALLSHRDRRGGVRSAGGELPVHLRHRVHGETGDRTGRHRRRQRRSGPTC